MLEELRRETTQWVQRAASAAGRLPWEDPVWTGTAVHRTRAAERMLQILRQRPLFPDLVLSGHTEAVRRFDEVMDEAIESLRTTPPETLRAKLLHWADRATFAQADEILDDLSYSASNRARLLEQLDALNEALGSYDRWNQFLEPMVRTAYDRFRRPLRVWDLASGHAGYALSLKSHFGRCVHVTATDLRAEYLELGRAKAVSRGLDIDFRKVDALELPEEAQPVDLFVCTQSLHHFSPGQVARILGGAMHQARLGIVCFDAERGMLPLSTIPLLLAAWTRSWAMVHDAWVSVRRMYSPDELWLLAQAAPRLPAEAQIDSGRLAPAFTYLTMLLPEASPQ